MLSILIFRKTFPLESKFLTDEDIRKVWGRFQSLRFGDTSSAPPVTHPDNMPDLEHVTREYLLEIKSISLRNREDRRQALKSLKNKATKG